MAWARIGIVVTVLLGTSVTSRAQEVDATVPLEVEKKGATAEPQSADAFEGAPMPGDAAGVRRFEPTTIGARALWVPRMLLIAPRWALEIVDAPVRAVAYAYDRYQLKERFTRIFFNDKETMGFYPVAFFETGFGINAGARFIHRDLFGNGERLRGRASYGGRFAQVYDLRFDSRHLLGNRFSFELEGEYAKENKAQFAGIGNEDEMEPEEIMGTAPADPTTRAVLSRFQQDVARARGVANFALVAGPPARIFATLSAAYTQRKFSENASLVSDASESYVALATAYDTDQLTGYDQGLSNVYVELGLTVDNRRPGHWFQTSALPATGWKVEAFAGRAKGFADDPSDYFRYGVDAQRYFDLFDGTRILVLRGYVETVTGDLTEVPFVDLPKAGGTILMRGYPNGRFRDRALVMGTAEYQYELDPSVAAFVFADGGRVYDGLGDFELANLRLGYGIGLQIHQKQTFVLRAFVGSSIDGGLQLNFSLDPAFDDYTRVERR